MRHSRTWGVPAAIGVALVLGLSAQADEPDVITHYGTSGYVTLMHGACATDSAVYFTGRLGSFGSYSWDAWVRDWDETLSYDLDTATAGDPDGNDALYRVVVGSTGIYVYGRTDDAIAGETNAGKDDAFVLKLDEDLSLLASNQIGTTDTDTITGMEVASSGVVIGGSRIACSACSFDGYVAWLDPSTLAVDWEIDPGVSGDFRVNDVAVDSAGVYAVGSDLTSGAADVWMMKFDHSGVEDTTFSASIAAPTDCDYPFLYRLVEYGGYLYAAGRATCDNGDGTSDTDIWVERYDAATGALDWSTVLDHSGSYEYLDDLLVSDEGAYLVGTTNGEIVGTAAGNGDILLLRLALADGSVDTTWQHQFGSSSYDTVSAGYLGGDPEGIWITGYTDGDLGGALVGARDGWAAGYYLESPLDLAPETQDFGDVEIGGSSVAVFTLTNTSDLDFEVTSVDLADGSGPFSVSASQTLPYDLAADETLDVTVTFAPSAEATYADSLEIVTGVTSYALLEVDLTGDGVLDDDPTSDEILLEAIEMFDDPTIDLVGSGPGSSAKGRKKALQNKLEAVGELIDDGDYEGACNALEGARDRVDGEPKPPDFVTGTAAGDLLDLIDELLDALGCA